MIQKNRTLKLFDRAKYATEDGWTMCREYGHTPDGIPLHGEWVLRDSHGEWVDYDAFITELAWRNGMVTGW